MCPFGLRGSRKPRGQLGNSKEPIHGPRELFGRPGRPHAWETPETDADSPGGSRRGILDCLGGQPGRQRANWVAERHHDSVSPGGPRWTTRAVWVAGRLQKASWIAWETPETGAEAPPFAEPGRLQMEYESYCAAREAAEGQLDSPGGSREPFERQLKGLGPLNLCVGRLSGR